MHKYTYALPEGELINPEPYTRHNRYPAPGAGKNRTLRRNYLINPPGAKHVLLLNFDFFVPYVTKL